MSYLTHIDFFKKGYWETLAQVEKGLDITLNIPYETVVLWSHYKLSKLLRMLSAKFVPITIKPQLYRICYKCHNHGINENETTERIGRSSDCYICYKQDGYDYECIRYKLPRERVLLKIWEPLKNLKSHEIISLYDCNIEIQKKATSINQFYEVISLCDRLLEI
jgi:hypothetical protein